MKITNLKLLKKIGAAVLALALFIGIPTIRSLAVDTSPNEPLGLSATQDNEGLILPLGISLYSAATEIHLPADASIEFYEDFSGTANYYNYYDDGTAQTIDGTFDLNTVLIVDDIGSFNSVNIIGNVQLARITSQGDLAISIQENSTFTIEEHSGEVPLEAVNIDIIGEDINTTKFFIKGKASSGKYDILTDALNIDNLTEFSAEPNAISVNGTFAIRSESIVDFKVGSSLPAGADAGVSVQDMELYRGAKLNVESTNLPDNAIHVLNDVALQPGEIHVTGGGKNAILVNGSSVQISNSSYVYAQNTAAGGTGFMHDPTTNIANANTEFSNSEVYAEGDAYGMKITGGYLSLFGAPDWKGEPIGESEFKGGIAALSIRSEAEPGFNLNEHIVNLTLVGNQSNAQGALYFDPSGAPSRIEVRSDGTINAVSEEHIFQGAAINVVDGFVAEEWSKYPILVEGTGQINTTMPTHQDSSFWAIKASGIDMGTGENSTLTQTYTDTVNLATIPSFPYNSSYNIELLEWSTDPANLRVNATANGFVSKVNAQNATLTGTTTTPPFPAVSDEPSVYRVIYNNVNFVHIEVITFDPTGGELSERTRSITAGQPIGELTDPVNPRKLFMGWFTEKDGKGTKVSAGYIVEDAITIYAYWTAPIQQITYQPNIPDTGVILQQVAMGEYLTPPEVHRVGHTLVNWYKDPELTTLWDFTSDYVPNAAVTLYAKWSVNEYTVTFIDTDSSTAVKALYGSLIKVPEDPANPRKLFMGWFTEKDGKGTKVGPDYLVEDSVNIYAYWTTPLQQITFQHNIPDTSVILQQVAMGEYLTLPEVNRVGHTLVNWYKDPELTIPWDFASDFVPNAAVTLYAKWSVNVYTVTFIGIEHEITQKVLFGSLISQPTDPKRADEEFYGWHYGVQRWNFQSFTMPAEDIVLGAHWLIDRGRDSGKPSGLGADTDINSINNLNKSVSDVLNQLVGTHTITNGIEGKPSEEVLGVASLPAEENQQAEPEKYVSENPLTGGGPEAIIAKAPVAYTLVTTVISAISLLVLKIKKKTDK